MPKINSLIIIVCICVCSCAPNAEVSDIELTDSNNNPVKINDVSSYKGTVITFLSPDCPVSENYTKTINDISTKYEAKNLFNFINIFPGKYYSDEELISFIEKFSLRQKNLFDKQLSLVHHLHATITPETFVLDENGDVVYSGAIDNWVVELGTKRQVVTEFYLEDVLYSLETGKEIEIEKTEAVGCFIEKK